MKLSLKLIYCFAQKLKAKTLPLLLETVGHNAPSGYDCRMDTLVSPKTRNFKNIHRRAILRIEELLSSRLIAFALSFYADTKVCSV